MMKTPKPKTKPVPKVKAIYDDEERALLEAIESKTYKPKNLLSAGKRSGYEAAARAAMNDGRIKISLRLSETDLARLKAKALREGMPYQTLIGSILHKAVAS